MEARLAADPEDAAKVDRLRQALRPLEADRDGYDPPPGLAVAAIARTAEYLVANGLVQAEPEPEPEETSADRPPSWTPSRSSPPGGGGRTCWSPPGSGSWRSGCWPAGVGRLRHDAQVAACQDGLRGLHVALTGYSDTHDGRYPEVGTRQVPVAGAFAAELARSGHLPPNQPVSCPVAAGSPRRSPTRTSIPAVGYAYTLGFVGPGDRVTGLRRADAPGGASDWTAVSADLPTPRPQAPHSRGQNVLYLGGMVRFAATPAAGVNGDDIYHNEAGVVRAGLHVLDTSLGRPTDIP